MENQTDHNQAWNTSGIYKWNHDQKQNKTEKILRKITLSKLNIILVTWQRGKEKSSTLMFSFLLQTLT